MTTGTPSPIDDGVADAGAAARLLLFPGLRDANLAHVLVLARSSSMNREEGRATVRCLLGLELKDFSGATPELPRFLEATLQQHLGSLAVWLNADRSRFEPVGVAFLTTIRQRILDLAKDHLEFAEATIALADRHRDTVISNPASQSAAVSTLGHCLLTYVYPAFRDLERLQHCFRSFNSSPCGTGKHGTGARIPIDHDLLRTLLGFDECRSHAGDALWQADGPIELVAAIVALLVNLNRLVDDLRSLASTDDSMNAAWIRSLTSGLLAKVPVLAALGKEGEEDVEGCLVVAEELCAAFDGAGRAIRHLALFVQRCAQNAAGQDNRGIYSAADSDLAEVFAVRGGIDYPSAQSMSREVDRLIEKGEIELQSLTPEAIDVIAVQVTGRPLNLTASDLASAIDPEQMVAARRGSGGAAPQRVIEMITECRARLVRENLWVTTARQRLAKSEVLLLAEAQEAAGF